MLALAWLSRDAIQTTEPPAVGHDQEEAVSEFNRVLGGPAPGPGEPRPGPDDARIGPGEAGADADTRSETATKPGAMDERSQGIEPEASEDNHHESERVQSKAGEAEPLSTGTLLANVVITQGLFLGVLVTGLWWTDVPARAVGLVAPDTALSALSVTSIGWSPTAIVLGTALGTALYVFNQVGAELGDRVGIDSSTELRGALAPTTTGGWVGLLGVALPVVAIFEELLFRGVLIGGLAVAGVETGTAVSPWLFVGLSAVAFALGHGAQGRGGILVTGALGGVLGAAFVLTWSLPLVIVAHYVVNALEFAIHEGLGIDWI
jgi:membrane protease YdiL (CAAX protease family)